MYSPHASRDGPRSLAGTGNSERCNSTTHESNPMSTTLCTGKPNIVKAENRLAQKCRTAGAPVRLGCRKRQLYKSESPNTQLRLAASEKACFWTSVIRIPARRRNCTCGDRNKYPASDTLFRATEFQKNSADKPTHCCTLRDLAAMRPPTHCEASELSVLSQCTSGKSSSPTSCGSQA